MNRQILAFFGFHKARGAILAYHSVGKNGFASTVSPEEFARQMHYIKEKKYEVIPLSEMCLRLKEGKSVRGAIALTFDDGYCDFFTNAFPVLKRQNFPATVFLITGKLGQELNPTQSKVSLKIMSAGDVKRASTANGLIEFMPHTESHHELSKLSITEAVKEINQSRTAVERLTGKPADIFAYPKGRYTSEVVSYLRKGDAWLGAVTIDQGHVDKESDLFLLKRLTIDAGTTLPIFKRKLAR